MQHRAGKGKTAPEEVCGLSAGWSLLGWLLPTLHPQPGHCCCPQAQGHTRAAVRVSRWLLAQAGSTGQGLRAAAGPKKAPGVPVGPWGGSAPLNVHHHGAKSEGPLCLAATRVDAVYLAVSVFYSFHFSGKHQFLESGCFRADPSFSTQTEPMCPDLLLGKGEQRGQAGRNTGASQVWFLLAEQPGLPARLPAPCLLPSPLQKPSLGAVGAMGLRGTGCPTEPICATWPGAQREIDACLRARPSAASSACPHASWGQKRWPGVAPRGWRKPPAQLAAL